MPKDIRSYFSVSPKKTTKEPDGVKKKKIRNIIISDSEDEDEDLKPKKTVNSKSPAPVTKGGGGGGSKTKREKSPYFDKLKPVNPADIFGSSSVKRSGVPVKHKKETKKFENTFEDDFNATLLQLDDKSVELLIKEGSSVNNSREDMDSGISELSTPNGFSDSIESRSEIPKKNCSGIGESSKSECLVLSESSDSDEDLRPSKKVKMDKTASKFSKSPEKKPLKTSENKPAHSPEKKVAYEKKKNECMDLSESDSEQETVGANKLSPQKKKVDSPKNQIISTKPEKKIIQKKPEQGPRNEFESKTGIKRRHGDDDDSFDQKKQKKTSFNEKLSSPEVNNAVPKVSLVSNLWVDKYKPVNLKQLIGQQGDKSNVKKLLNWLQNWKKNHNGKTKLSKPSPWARDDDGSFFKAALLSGPPGIGKTTTSHLVCKELQFDVVEFNASDTRSKKSLQQEVSELLSTKSLAPYFSGSNEKEVTSNHVLLMDEVDGMAGNEDRGGIQELIQLIRSSRVPVICMCNDRNHPKMRSLVNYCYDLRYSRPRVEQIKGAMMSVCFKEGLKISPEQLTDIIKSTNQDIRLILNHLSVLAAQKDSNLPNSEKFVKLGPWDVLRKVFSEEELKKMSFYDKCDLFFHDYSIAPLFVQENYLSVVPHAKLNKIEKMKVYAKAAESICTGDVVEKLIRKSNAWSLLPVEAIFASVVPGETLCGHMGGQINFPSWLGKNSTKNKMDRLQQELLVHTRLKVSGSKEAINLDYSSHLRELIVRPLVQNGSEGVRDALNGLQSYDLLKEDLENLSELCKWPSKKDPMDKVESKVKAAFTRAYNKSSNMSPYAVTASVKKGRGGGGVEVDNSDLLVENNDDAAPLEADEEEEGENIEIDAMIVAKKKTSKNQTSVPSTSKQSSRGKRAERGRKK